MLGEYPENIRVVLFPLSQLTEHMVVGDRENCLARELERCQKDTRGLPLVPTLCHEVISKVIA